MSGQDTARTKNEETRATLGPILCNRDAQYDRHMHSSQQIDALRELICCLGQRWCGTLLMTIHFFLRKYGLRDNLKAHHRFAV